MDDLNLNQWWEIFSRTGRGNPRAYTNYVANRGGAGYQTPVIESVVDSSPGLQVARQILPNNLAETGAGQWIQSKLPDRYKQKVAQVPLGGLSLKEREAYSKARASDPELRANTIEIGRVPLGNTEVPVGDSVRAASAQLAGAVAGDIATDGIRNIWWFLNAPQAITQIAMLSAMHRAGSEYKSTSPNVPLLRNQALRMAATLPAVLGVSMAIGNAWRQPGYKATVPSEVDPTQTADPLAEFGSRYILGRSGSLLPYDEFVKERPDVSRQEYENYKQYLFGNALPLKATLDGIQGPEVTFMGKSIPVLTGVLPAVAAVIGGRYGVRKAAANLAGIDRATGRRVGDDMLAEAEELRLKTLDEKTGRPNRDSQAYAEYDKLQRANEMKVLRNALLYSGGAMTGTALAGQTLESLRRALKGNVPVEQEQQPVLAPQPTSMV
jgi:hypothetical protein